MGTKEIEEILGKIKKENPAAAEQIEKVMQQKSKLLAIYEKEAIKDIVIDGKPAKLIIYKSSKIEVHFRDNIERDHAISLLK